MYPSVLSPFFFLPRGEREREREKRKRNRFENPPPPLSRAMERDDNPDCVTRKELRGLVSSTTLKNMTAQRRLRTTRCPNDGSGNDAQTVGVASSERHDNGHWYGLEDIVRCLGDASHRRLRMMLCSRLGLLRSAKDDELISGMREHCLHRRRLFSAQRFSDYNTYRHVFTSTVDDYDMQSYGYKAGTSVRVLERFFAKDRARFSTDDYVFAKVPDVRLECNARQTMRTELWMRPEMKERLDAVVGPIARPPQKMS